MQAILPGKPQAKLQALDYGYHDDQVVIVYVSGTALVILNGAESLLQTIYHDEVGTQGLHAVTFCEATGKIAVASTHNIYIYGLREEIKGTLRWAYEQTIIPAEDSLPVETLSWGSDEELLVGSRALTLFSAHLPSRPSSPATTTLDSTTTPIWSKAVSSPVSYASFSPSASLIATLSPYNYLVKIWRRLSFEAPQFDYAYLRHPATVTHMEWRRVRHDVDGREDEVLYTICADGKFRIWRQGDLHSVDVLSFHAEIDMVSAIQPRDPLSSEASPRRYAFVIDAGMVDVVTRLADSAEQKSQDKHAVEHLKEIASREPDIVVILDDYGHMSAWGLENVGCKKRNSDRLAGQPFHIAHIEGMSVGIEHASNTDSPSRILSLMPAKASGDLALLSHHFDGRILWQQVALQDLLDPSAKQHRIRDLSLWTGHSGAVKKIIRTASGTALISRTDENEGIVWTLVSKGKHLVQKSSVSLKEHIHRTVLLRDGAFAVFLHHESISVWDTRQSQSTEIARCEYSLESKPLCLLILPELHSAHDIVHLATVCADMHGIVWELHLSTGSQHTTATNGLNTVSMKQLCLFTLDEMKNVSYILPVDPAGGAPNASGFLDSFAQDVAVSYTSTGLLRTYTARVEEDGDKVDFLTTATVDTGVQEPSLGSATSIRKAALVNKDRSSLTIWDTRSGRLDHEETFPDQSIQDLDWASTPDNQSILAVGFAHRVLVYTQLRYDYVNERPAWARIKEILIRDLTPHPIGDSVWFTSGSLVIAAGNQMFVASNTIDLQKDLAPELQISVPHSRASHLYELVRRMNGPLPVFHPQFISQCVLAGKTDMAHRILVNLNKTLKFYTEGEELDALQGLGVEDFLVDTTVASAQRRKTYNETDDDEPSTVTEALAESLKTLLTQKSIPQLTSAEQFSLADITECVATVEKHRRSIDENAARFLLFWRESIIRSHQKPVNGGNKTPQPSVSWREMVWAYHSTSQDILIDLIAQHYKGRLEWSYARNTGIFMWLADREALLKHFETVARNAYTATEPKDPVVCTLHYLALRKKAVLQGLWRMATWSREQGATTRLLKNDFTDARWKTAAAKNAYALMGRRRFEYAAAFFLLADDLKSAVSVLSNQLDDVQLAVAVARVYEGDNSPVLQSLLTNRVLPIAAEENNRWQATWAFWLLGDKSSAVRALVSPLHQLLSPPTPPPPSIQAKTFLNDDPALIVMYRQLRTKSLQTLKGALRITGQEEWGFIVKTASLLRRMGCDVLALDLVANWEFLLPQQPMVTVAETDEAEESISELPPSPTLERRAHSALEGYDEIDPRKLLRRRSSLVVDDLPPSPGQMRPGYSRNSSARDTKPAQAKSMLDGWDSGGAVQAVKPQQAKEMIDTQKAKPVEKKKPTQFKEPEANSLLDSFGF